MRMAAEKADSIVDALLPATELATRDKEMERRFSFSLTQMSRIYSFNKCEVIVLPDKDGPETFPGGAHVWGNVNTRPYDWALGSGGDGRLPAGADEGAVGMREGGWRRLVVPNAYGAAGLRKSNPLKGGLRYTPPKAGFVINMTTAPDEIYENSGTTSAFSRCVFAVSLGYLDMCVAQVTMLTQRVACIRYRVVRSQSRAVCSCSCRCMYMLGRCNV